MMMMMMMIFGFLQDKVALGGAAYQCIGLSAAIGVQNTIGNH